MGTYQAHISLHRPAFASGSVVGSIVGLDWSLEKADLLLEQLQTEACLDAGLLTLPQSAPTLL